MCGFYGNLRYLNLHLSISIPVVLYRDLQQANSNLIKFNQENCKVLHPEMNNPKHQYGLRPTSWKTALQERPWGSWWTTS